MKSDTYERVNQAVLTFIVGSSWDLSKSSDSCVPDVYVMVHERIMISDTLLDEGSSLAMQLLHVGILVPVQQEQHVILIVVPIQTSR